MVGLLQKLVNVGLVLENTFLNFGYYNIFIIVNIWDYEKILENLSVSVFSIFSKVDDINVYFIKL